MAEAPAEFEIKDKTAYRAAMKTLAAQNRPPAILRLIMRAFESYRQARKFGWSRPWNKYGIMTFQSFKLDFARDAALIDAARAVLAAEGADMPAQAAAFADDLLGDGGALMGFIFVHEFCENGGRFEGATLSFGRIKERRYRDRLDLIVEAPIVNAGAGGFSRLRLFVDPYRTDDKKPLYQTVVPAPGSEAARALFDLLSETSSAWADDGTRAWNHWTSAYIDYFGPRPAPVAGSHFHQTNP